MKRKNGFTLIELLVVIAIMMSILVIAIVNLNNVNKNKKEEAWAAVKEQIQTAATEYFTANEYLFEGLNEGSKGVISVGKLVSDDYLNKVTDPRSGKAVSYCAKVNVTKTGNKLSAEFDDSDDSLKSTQTNCDTQSTVIVKEPGAPEISLSPSCTNNGSNGWCKGNEKVTLRITKKNGSIETKKYCQGDGYCDPTGTIPENNKMTDSNEGGSRVTKVAVKNQAGTAYAEVGYKIDKTAPTGNITISSSSDLFNSNIVDILVNNLYDNLSGAKKVNFSNNDYEVEYDEDSNPFVEISGHQIDTSLSGASKTVSATIYDAAGNSTPISSSPYVVYKECGGETEEDIKYGPYGACSVSCGKGTKSRNKTVKVKDKYTSKTCSESTTKDNSGTCNITCDTTAPTVTVSIYKKKKDGSYGSLVDSQSIKGHGNEMYGYGWFSKDESPYGFIIYYKSNEDLSKVESFWNKAGLKKTSADGNTYEWKSSTHYKDGGSANLTATKKNKWGYTTLSAEGARRMTFKFYDSSNNYTHVQVSLNMDRTPPTVTYLSGPKAQSCGGAKGVYIKYKVEDSLSGVKEVYHYYGKTTNVKTYKTISDYNIRVLNQKSEGLDSKIIERNWAVGNPNGCASENKAGPNTSWCYRNNSAVKDWAGNTATGISSSCHKVGW